MLCHAAAPARMGDRGAGAGAGLDRSLPDLRRPHGRLSSRSPPASASSCSTAPARGRGPRRSSPLWMLSPVVAWCDQPAAARRRHGAAARPTTRASCARRRGGRGASSRPSSDRRTTRSRPTTSRRTRSRSSRIAPRRPTSASISSRPSRAHDFGWIGLARDRRPPRARRSTRVDGLERFRGHLYNWYETRDGRPLEPEVRLDRRQRQSRGPPASRCARRAASCRATAARSGGARRHRATRLAGAARRLRAVSSDDRPDADRDAARTSTTSLDGRRRGARSGFRTPRSPGPRASATLETLADTMADIARTLRAERDDRRGGESWSSGRRRCARRSRATRATSTRSLPWARRLHRQGSAAAAEAPRRCPRRRTRRTRTSACAPRSATAAIARRWPSELDERGGACAALARRLAALGRLADGLAPRDGLRASSSIPTRKLFAIGYRVRRRRARPQLLRPARLRGAPRELRRDRQGRRAGVALVPARPRADAGRPRLRARLVVGLDVRVPDADAGHARADRQPARADLPRSSCAARSQYGAERGVPWGISESAFNVRDLDLTYQYSSFGVPGLGLEARPQRGPRRRALRDGAGRDGRRRGRGAELRAPGGGRRPRRATASTRRSTTPRAALPEGADGGAGARLHGAPPGHDAGRARERAARRRHAAALPRRADRAGDRAAAPGAHAARRRRRARRAPRRCTPRRTCATSSRRSSVASRSPHGPIPRTPSALERALRGDADGRGLGLQPLARPRGHALARGRHARLLGAVRLPARRRRAARSGRPATSRRGAEADSYEAIFSEDRAEIRRRDGAIATTLGGRGLARGRRRGAAGLAHQPRRAARARSS